MKRKNRILIYSLFVIVLILTNSCEKDNGADPIITVEDIDGNIYHAVTIGTQVWMAENLKTTRYADGTAIPLVNTTAGWDSLTIPSQAYCWNNDDIENKATYGALYTWSAATKGASSTEIIIGNVQGVCPTGWHLPEDSEWDQLESYLIENGYNYDGTSILNRIAKSLADTTYWNSSTEIGSPGNTDYPDIRNQTGFTARPAGNRSYLGGRFDFIGEYGYWWSTTPFNTELASIRTITYYWIDLGDYVSNKEMGFSVRCVKD